MMKKYIDEMKDILNVYSHSTNIACRVVKVKRLVQMLIPKMLHPLLQ
ncbi:hypothetical protein [Halocella sp. SP3-1]|nr:hypothetical protein [Halocella sp. SP3-1]